MKALDEKSAKGLKGTPLAPGDTFKFRCFPGVACFNRCCRNLNLYLQPYDVPPLRKNLGMTSGEFLDRHTDVVLRPDSYFPEVLLRMSDDAEKTCPFLTDQGCAVYEDRAESCRMFPVEHGMRFDERGRASEMAFFFRPPDFCEGKNESDEWTPDDWTEDQDLESRLKLAAPWAERKSLFLRDLWGAEGPTGPKARMAFMSLYNIDDFRDFIFASTFRKRFFINKKLQQKLKKSDRETLLFAFEWVKFSLWRIEPKMFSLR